jgi:hypothetical protein
MPGRDMMMMTMMMVMMQFNASWTITGCCCSEEVVNKLGSAEMLPARRLSSNVLPP